MNNSLNPKTNFRNQLAETDINDAELQIIERCLLDERHAQRQLYEQYSGKVYRLMYRMVGPEYADDLTLSRAMEGRRPL